VTDTSRPEPVVDEGKIAGAIAGAIVAVVAVVLLVIRGQASDLSALQVALQGALSAVMAAAAVIVPVWRAYRARRKVTPLADPRDDDGTPLVADLGDGATGAPWVVQPQRPGEPDHAAPDEG